MAHLTASDGARGPEFESSHRQLLFNIYLLSTVGRKDEKRKRVWEGRILYVFSTYYLFCSSIVHQRRNRNRDKI